MATTLASVAYISGAVAEIGVRITHAPAPAASEKLRRVDLWD
jgi:hypothetical protein